MSAARSAWPPDAIGPRYAFTFWPSSVTSTTPCCASERTSASTCSSGRLTSSPRVYGTTQKVQYLLQPSMIETKAVTPSARGSGSRSNFSISGKLMSTTARPWLRNFSSMSGRRWIVCGPNTRSTNGARSVMPSPSWLATQPPTPMMTCGRAAFRSRQRPSCENTFSCAFSRTEHVLSSSRSASSGFPVGS